MADYFRPATLSEALAILQRQPCRPLAGGTDFYPAEASARAWGQPGLAHPERPATLDISAIDSLRGLHERSTDIEIGALTTWSQAIDSTLPAWFDGVRLAGREVGGAQIQNRGTLVGNLCNASPAADGVPALLALDARVRLQSSQRVRELPLREFILGNRQTARQPDELVTAILIPKLLADTHAGFLKLGARQYLVISIVMVAVALSTDAKGLMTHAAVSVGACSAVAQRLTELEQRLVGAPLAQAASLVRASDFAMLTPIDDIRASAAYRRHSAQVLVRRGLQQVAGGKLARAA